MDDQGQVVITGGQGALAQAMGAGLVGAGLEVRLPGRSELDVLDEGSVEGYFAELCSLDLVVCNAGVTGDGVLSAMKERTWDDVLDVNLKGAFLVAKAAAKMMVKQRRGHIVFVSSYSAFHPPVGQANYAAAKAGLTGMALSMARELGGRGVRVNTIVPGFMETPMTQGLPGEVREAVRQKHVLGAFNTVECVAQFLKCLHCDMEYTSGQIFNLDSRLL